MKKVQTIMDKLTLKFHPTGKGYILCERTRPDGSTARSIRYAITRWKSGPLGLTPAQQAEWDLAYQMEKEDHEQAGS
jgi:hypothetical protein